MTSAVRLHDVDPAEAPVVIRAGTATFVLRPAPCREPPFEDELDEGWAPAVYDRPLPFARPTRRHPAPFPARSAMPDPSQWCRRLLVGVIETAAGRRPLNQVAALLSPSVAHGLRSEFEHAARGGRPHWLATASVRSTRSTTPAENVAEVCATVLAGRRIHAVAIRLEVHRGRWCCTRLVLG